MSRRSINWKVSPPGRQGDLASAIRLFHKSGCALIQNQSEVWFNLGIHCAVRRAQAKARTQQTAFESMIALSPLAAAGHLQRAATLACLDRYRDYWLQLATMPSDYRAGDPLTAIHRAARPCRKVNCGSERGVRRTRSRDCTRPGFRRSLGQYRAAETAQRRSCWRLRAL